ncbi:hypothetical protein NQ314_001597, partial [Rhamnusium bicolor]
GLLNVWLTFCAKKEMERKCKDCKQNLRDVILHKKDPLDSLNEVAALERHPFCLYKDHGEVEGNAVPSAKVTSFMVYDKHDHLCPLDTGLIEKGIKLYLSGYLKTIDQEDPSTENSIPVCKIGPIKEWYLLAGQAVATGETWYRRLGHINSGYLNKMRDGLVDGINYNVKLQINLQNYEVCCCEGKQASQTFGHSGTRATGLLDLIHTDLAGPMETTSIGGSKYYGEFPDDSLYDSRNQEFYSINKDSSSEQRSGELVFSEEGLSDETYVSEDRESISLPENVNRSQRERKLKKLEDFVTYFTSVEQANSKENPDLVAEALAGPNQNKWISAMTDEIKSGSTALMEILSYDEETSEDEVPMISISCIQTLINLTGISLNKQAPKIPLQIINKKNSSIFTKVATTNLVREVFQKFFHEQIQDDYVNNECQLSECAHCINCKEIKQCYGSGMSKQSKKQRCESYLEHSESSISEQNESGNKPAKHKECSKQIIHTVKWLKKSAIKYNGCQGYSSVNIDDFVVRQGDYVMLYAEFPTNPLRIAKVSYMYDSPDEGAMFHAHFFCRGTDTILGETADPRELFVVDDCDDYPLGCILQKTEVEFRKNPQDWADLGGNLNLPLIVEDKTTLYFFSKIYDYEFSKFKDYNEDITELTDACVSCKWQRNIKSNETPIYKDNCILWRKELFKIGTAIFLEPGQTKYVPLPEEEKNYTIENKLYTEMYRKTNDVFKGSNINTPDPLIWTTFKNVSGKCYVTYSNDKSKAREWSQMGPFRFYFSKAYNHKTFQLEEPPHEGRQLIYCDANKEDISDEKYNLRNRRNYTQDNNNHEIPPKWEQIDNPVKCMDIYAGCGGLSEGLHQAGVAKTLWAVSSGLLSVLNNPECRVYTDDCNNILRTLLSGKGKDSGLPDKGEVDLLVGGPPCQGFSGMNRPKYLIFENVRNFVSFKKSIIFKLTLRCLLAMGYQVSFGILQAGNFGVPQTRRRFILMGAAPGYALPNLPEPLHVFSRSGSFLSIVVDGLRYDTGSNWTESLPYRTICVRDAIADLPEIQNGSLTMELPYDANAKSHFQKNMRKMNINDLVKDHICKEMSPIVEARISHIPSHIPGADWRDLPNKVVRLRDGSVTNILKYPYRKKDQRKTDSPRGVCKCATGSACDSSDRQYNTLIPWCLSHTADRHNNWPAVYGRLDWEGFFGTTITNPEPMGTQGRGDLPNKIIFDSTRIRGGSGEMLASPVEQLERWREYFSESLSCTAEPLDEEPEVAQRNLRIDTKTPSVAEIITANKHLKPVLHPEENRVVSVRECARSQGFHDEYKFCGNILDKHRQIGNAVPPPLALALGREIIKAYKIQTILKKKM